MSSTGPPSPDPAARLGPPATRRHGTVLVAVGDELLGGFTLDSNSHWLAGRLREAGYPVVRIEVVSDRLEDITGAVRRAVADAACDRVVVSGGLGPTTDDRTLEALASALDRPLVTDRAALEHVRALVQRMHAAGWVDSPEPSPANLRMTVVPDGATVLENRRGMAPGLAYPVAPVVDAAQGEPGASAERWLLVLPGVPRELKTLVEEEALPRLFGEGMASHVVELEYGHAVEADFFEPMRTLEREFPDVAIGSYPQTETRRLVIRLRGADADRVEAAVRRLRSLRPLPGA